MENTGSFMSFGCVGSVFSTVLVLVSVTFSSSPWLLFLFSIVAAAPKENLGGSVVLEFPALSVALEENEVEVWGPMEGMLNMDGGISFFGAALAVGPKDNLENGFGVDNVGSSLGTSRFRSVLRNKIIK